MEHVSRRRRRVSIIAVAVALLVAGAIAAYASRGRIEEAVAPPAPAASPLPQAVAMTPEEAAFYRFVGARLGALTGESVKLQQLGEARSRNLVELRVRADRIDQISGQIDDYLAAGPIPPRFGLAIDRYRAGIDIARAGVAATRTAFTRFDWDGVAAGLDTFERGVGDLDAAYAELREAAGLTPAATPAAAVDLFTEFRPA